MAYVIRNASEADLDGLEKIEERCFSIPWTRAQLQSQLPDERHEFLVAADADGGLLGYIGMMTVLDEGYISNVAVAPQARRRGMGRELVRQMLRRAAARKLSFVTLEVREHNNAAIALYASEGFREVGKRKNYYECPKEDALLMTVFFEQKDEVHENTCL